MEYHSNTDFNTECLEMFIRGTILAEAYIFYHFIWFLIDIGTFINYLVFLNPNPLSNALYATRQPVYREFNFNNTINCSTTIEASPHP
jgi:hypothetical protein